MPHFWRNFSHPPPQTRFGPKLGLILLAITYRKGPFSETDGLSMIFVKFWEIADDRPRADESLFFTLIAASNAPFLASF